jgi:hypothetical protein
MAANLGGGCFCPYALGPAMLANLELDGELDVSYAAPVRNSMSAAVSHNSFSLTFILAL